VSVVEVKLIADALLTQTSIPPNFFTVSSIAFWQLLSSRMSTAHGNAFPPAASISSATWKIEN
jgi:hypothetical protein